MSRVVSRRSFVQSALGAAAAFAVPTALPSRVFGANERLNIGVIGVGNRGAANLQAVTGENIIAICDVDQNFLDAASAVVPNAKKYHDYREMLDLKELDAVVVATPDHHHAPATMRALNRGLHVYCEKPLTHTVEEARLIAQVAAEKKLATQMGTQNHEHPGYLRLVELIRSGAIGTVKEVHAITDRPGSFWTQGMDVPMEKQPIPSTLKWDLWLGPAAERDYHSAYVPFLWRGWWDFGCGAVGDMAIHLLDPAFWALELGGPVKVSSEGPEPNPHSGPKWMKTQFEFGQRGELPPVKLFWYEGETHPAAEIAKELPMNGSLFIGEKGRIAVAHGGMPKLLPEEDFADFKAPAPSLPESPGHHQQWINACKNATPTSSNFGYAGPFTETVLLGNVAYRVGQPIEYDPASMKITNVPQANRLLTKTYRKGWEVKLA